MSRNGLFSHGQNFCPKQNIFCLGQFWFCPRQKIFCPGRRTRHKVFFCYTANILVAFLCQMYSIKKLSGRCRLMPRPSARTKKFCLGQKQICPAQKFLSEVKKSSPVLLEDKIFFLTF